MDNELQTLLEEFNIEKADANELPEDAVKALKDAMKILNKYKEDFPEDLKSALGVIATHAAVSYGKKPVQKDSANDISTNADGTEKKWPSLTGAVIENQVQAGL